MATGREIFFSISSAFLQPTSAFLQPTSASAKFSADDGRKAKATMSSDLDIAGINLLQTDKHFSI